MYNKLLKILTKRVELYGAQCFPFGVFGVINYPMSFLFWHQISPDNYTNLIFRLLITALCIPLIFVKFWPKSWKQHLPFYWYFTVWVSLPLFGSFMLLKNSLSLSWLMNEMLGLFLFILLVDWLSFIVLLVLGAGFSWLLYWLTVSNTQVITLHSVLLAAYMYTLVFIIGVVFSRNKENAMLRKRMNAARLVSSCIAHELRSPLASIRASLEAVSCTLPTLTESYQMAKAHKIAVPLLSKKQQEGLERSVDYSLSEVKASNVIINMILYNLGDLKMKGQSQKQLSIMECIQSAFARYPFYSNKDAGMVHINKTQDFMITANYELLVHVLFNLIKNALYHIHSVGKGEIYIRLSCDNKHNLLIFEDTGPGIPYESQAQIFERFYSEVEGAGVGLAFCKMVMNSINGNIHCDSVPGAFTRFILTFPCVRAIEHAD